MKLPALALFERALRLESRSALMCWSRVGSLVVILFVLLPVQRMAQIGWYGAPGLRFFQSMVWANFVFITLAGLSYFASAITEEKEEMMLGLLRMTDLDAVSILLGKSTSRLIGAGLLLLVQLPFILLAVTLGGVGLLQIAAAYATLLAYLFLLCNLALLFSVVFRNTATVAAVTLFLLLIFFVGCYLAGAIEQHLALSHNVDLAAGRWPVVTAMIDFWKEATPVHRLGVIFQSGFTGPIIGFQVASNLVFGVVAFLLAWAVFDWCTREEKEAAPVLRWGWRRTSRPSRMPPRLAGARAITWKDFTFISGGKFGLLIKFGVVGLLMAVCNIIAWKTGAPTDLLEFEGGLLIWISLLSTAMWLALEASRIFNEEVRWKTLSSLMTLPIFLSELAYRKVAGAALGTLPLLACCALGCMMVPDKVGKFFKEMARDPGSFGFLTVTVLQYILFLHLTAYLSLVLKRGALPLAIAIHYIGGTFLLGLVSALLFTGGGDALFVIGLLCVVLIVVLHVAIGFRLARAAAEE